jgi:YHS domain-containing protein
MLVRFLLELILVTIIGRTFWRMVDGLIQGLTGTPRPPKQPSRAAQPPSSMPMKRDPVCGTFVLPGRAVTLSSGRDQLYFCSTGCRDTYLRQRPAAGRTA